MLLPLALGAAPAVGVAALDAAGQPIASRVLQSGDLLVAALGIAVALVVGRARIALSVPRRARMALALVVGVGLPGFAGALHETTVSNDERAYLLQAEIFAEGRLAEPLLDPAPEGFSHSTLFRRQVHEDAERGVRFAKYPPGVAAALTPGAWLGWPDLVRGLAALLILLGAGAAARRFEPEDDGTALVLLALSPFFLLVATSFQSELFTAPAAVGGWAALLRLRDSRARVPAGRAALLAAAVGAASGWIFVCRPLTGVLFAAAASLGLRPRSGEGVGACLPRFAAATLGGLPFLALLLLYQAAQTGDPWLAPYAAYAERFGPFDPETGAPLDVFGRGDFWPGLLRQGARASVAVGGVLGLVGVGLAGLWRRRAADGGAALAFAVLLPLAYAFHWYAGHWAYLGPLYAFEALPMLVVGLASALRVAPSGLRRGVVAAAFVPGLLLFGNRLAANLEHAALRDAPARALEQAPDDAVVLLPFAAHPRTREALLKRYTPSRDPRATGVVFLRELPDPDVLRERLVEFGLEGRPLLRFFPGETPDDFLLLPYQP